MRQCGAGEIRIEQCRDDAQFRHAAPGEQEFGTILHQQSDDIPLAQSLRLRPMRKAIGVTVVIRISVGPVLKEDRSLVGGFPGEFSMMSAAVRLPAGLMPCMRRTVRTIRMMKVISRAAAVKKPVPGDHPSAGERSSAVACTLRIVHRLFGMERRRSCCHHDGRQHEGRILEAAARKQRGDKLIQRGTHGWGACRRRGASQACRRVAETLGEVLEDLVQAAGATAVIKDRRIGARRFG